jgi:hypothetical protein
LVISFLIQKALQNQHAIIIIRQLYYLWLCNVLAKDHEKKKQFQFNLRHAFITMHLLPLYSILEICYNKATSSNTNNTSPIETIQVIAKPAKHKLVIKKYNTN